MGETLIQVFTDNARVVQGQITIDQGGYGTVGIQVHHVFREVQRIDVNNVTGDIFFGQDHANPVTVQTLRIGEQGHHGSAGGDGGHQ